MVRLMFNKFEDRTGKGRVYTISSTMTVVVMDKGKLPITIVDATGTVGLSRKEFNKLKKVI